MNKRTAISIIIIMLLAAGGGYALWQTRDENSGANGSTQQQTSETDQSTSEDDQSSTEEAEDNVNGSAATGEEEPENSEEKNKPEENDNTESNQSTADVTLSSLSQSSSRVKVRAFVDENGHGTCTVRFEKSGQSPVERSAETRRQTSYYACKGFDVVKTEFPVKGEWTVQVTFTSDNTSGESRKESINIR